MKHMTRPKMQAPEGTYTDPETGAVVMPEGTPFDVVPTFTQEEHDGPVEECEECSGPRYRDFPRPIKEP